jgi:hypothetical protein
MTITLEQLIQKLKTFPSDAQVSFDFCGFRPTTFNSWRCLYHYLALGYAENRESNEIDVKQLLEKCENAINSTFEGWKGGQYAMDKDTCIWVDNKGECSYTAIVDAILVNEYTCILVTQYSEID